MENKELKLVYDTLLSAPGMDENVKVDFRISRKVALFLATVIEKGLSDKAASGRDLLALSTGVSREELGSIAKDILAKAGLSELNDKLRSLQ